MIKETNFDFFKEKLKPWLNNDVDSLSKDVMWD